MERSDKETWNASRAGMAAVDLTEAESGEPTVAELKDEIAETQGQLHQTLSDIQERLTPAHLTEQAKNTVRDAAMGKVTAMADQIGNSATRMVDRTRRVVSDLPQPVRDNPWPLVLVGIGVVWFIASSRSKQGRRDWNDDEASASSTSGATAVGKQVRTVVGDIGQRAHNLSSRTERRLSGTMHDSPMMVGAVAVAAGALIGTLLPGTGMEDEYMGETRDEVFDSARALAQDKLNEASSAAVSALS